MFDIAWSELFVILLVALVVVGPKDLPKMMRTVGQWAGRARAMADQFRRSFDEMTRHAELDELRSEVNRLKNVASQPLTDADYKALGIDLPPLPTSPTASVIEDVGAAPPKLDEPQPPPLTEAPAQASAEAPAAAPETQKLEISAAGAAP